MSESMKLHFVDISLMGEFPIIELAHIGQRRLKYGFVFYYFTSRSYMRLCYKNIAGCQKGYSVL